MPLDSKSESLHKPFSCEEQNARLFLPFKERFNVGGGTHQIDFADVPYFEDPRGPATACVVVLTSDGTHGTLSHLTVAADPKQFAEDLRDLIRKDGASVCLSGGSSALPDGRTSHALVDKLVDGLGKAGFHVSRSSQHSDLLGDFNRRVILYPDRVVVMRQSMTSSDKSWQPRELRFPREFA